MPQPTRSSLPGGATLTAGAPPHRTSFGQTRTGSNLTITPSVTITPTSAPSSASKQRGVSKIDRFSFHFHFLSEYLKLF